MYMSYNKYLQQKADIPLYLATAEAHQTGNLQAELSDRDNNVTQKIKKSSADLINFYEGAEISPTRAKFVAASLLKMIAVSAFVKFIGDFAEGKINRFVEGNKTVILEKDGYEAVLALTEYNKQKSWLLTGWKTNEPDEISEVSTQSDPMQLKPTFSRQELGAGLTEIISQLPENASGNQEKSGIFISPGENVRFSIAPVDGDGFVSTADREKMNWNFIF